MADDILDNYGIGDENKYDFVDEVDLNEINKAVYFRP